MAYSNSSVNTRARSNSIGSIWAIPTFFILLMVGQIINNQVAQVLYYGGVTVAPQEGHLLELYRQGDLSLRACEQRNTQILVAYKTLCPSCKVVQASCTNSPPKFVLQALSESPIDFPSARTVGSGVLVYKSANRDQAKEVCEQVAKVSDSLFCMPPGSDRPLSVGEFSAKSPEMRVDRLVSKVLYALLGLLATLVVLSAVKKVLAGEEFSQANLIQKLTLSGFDFFSIMLAYFMVGLPTDMHPVQLYQYDLRSLVLQALLGLGVVGWLWVHYQQYSRRRPVWDELRELFKTLLAAMLIISAALFYSGVDEMRDLTLWAWGFAVVLVPVGRVAARQILNQLGLWKRPVLIVGAGENALDAYKAIQDEFALGYQVVGFVAITAEEENKHHFIEVRGKSVKKYVYDESFSDLLAKLNKPQIVLAVDSMANKNAQTILHQLSLMSDNLHVIPSLRGLPLFGAEVSHFFSQEVVFLTVRNNLSRRSHQLIKRCFDLIVSSLAIILLSPLFLVLVYLVKQDGGHAFYGHERIGKNGRTFKCLKFRSMHADSERMLKRILATDPVARAEWEKDFKLRNDPRITKVGKFLRKTSADELPQLFNVLSGEMSLVGPRPIVEAELERYGSASTYYLSVTPGITGLWQVSGRNDTSYKERVALDAWYAQNWSMWYDIAILFKTVGVVFGRKGAY